MALSYFWPPVELIFGQFFEFFGRFYSSILKENLDYIKEERSRDFVSYIILNCAI